VRRRGARGATGAPEPAILAFAAFVGLSLVLLILSGTEPARAVRGTLATLLEPARAAVAGVGETVVGAFDAIGDIGALRAENAALRERLAAAEQRAAELTEAAAENGELRELLGFARTLDMELVPARVTARDASNVAAEASLDVGSDDGVRAGMPVVAAADGGGGLFGTVTDVTTDTARVRLVVDPRSVVIAVDQQTRALGEARGQAGAQLTLGNVPLTEPMAVGDTVVTAGLRIGDDASLYPGGLLIGRIEAVEPDENALTHTAFVRPAVDPSEVSRVLVIVDFEEAAPSGEPGPSG
jgi:rod shape-determining protein MreC